MTILLDRKRKAIEKIHDFLEKHPIGMINPEKMLEWPLVSIEGKLKDFENDLIRKPGE